MSDYIFISLIQSLANKSVKPVNKKLFSPENDEQKAEVKRLTLLEEPLIRGGVEFVPGKDKLIRTRVGVRVFRPDIREDWC